MHGNDSITPHSTATFSMRFSVAKMLLTVFGAFPFKRRLIWTSDLRERVLVAIPILIRGELVEDTRYHRGQRDNKNKHDHRNENGRHNGPPRHVDERTYGESTFRV